MVPQALKCRREKACRHTLFHGLVRHENTGKTAFTTMPGRHRQHTGPGCS
ncbi:hypothetical protein HMPREF0742_01218 [Rothia aeria F0184]|uniref:Uncharacterized protein n=1 Tax=Rothia aeria F0184 TaxID=888019 RepID=U7V3B6_9MICC|nr:hypothetical protein HMPREF0742_01218 [Rothia aeria F0184]